MKLCVAVLLLVVIAPGCRAFTSVDIRRYEIELILDYFGDRTPSCSRDVLLVSLQRGIFGLLVSLPMSTSSRLCE